MWSYREEIVKNDLSNILSYTGGISKGENRSNQIWGIGEILSSSKSRKLIFLLLFQPKCMFCWTHKRYNLPLLYPGTTRRHANITSSERNFSRYPLAGIMGNEITTLTFCWLSWRKICDKICIKNHTLSAYKTTTFCWE